MRWISIGHVSHSSNTLRLDDRCGLFFGWTFFYSSIKNPSTMEIRSKRILSRTEWILRYRERKIVIAFEYWGYARMRRIKRDAQKPDALTLISFFVASFRSQTHTCTMPYHAIASLGIVCTWHWFLTDRPTCERTTCECAHVFRPRKQDSALCFFFRSPHEDAVRIA